METHYLTRTNLAQVLLPPLYEKLGLTKQFIIPQPKYGEFFRYLCSKFPKLPEAKLKEGVVTGPDIRKLLSDSLFSETMGDKEKEAWDSFKDAVHRFLENTKDPLYKTIVQRMLTAYEAQGCKMSLKVHFIYSHIVKIRVKDFTRMSVIARGDTMPKKMGRQHAS
ncbi:hypothetical protein AVEN_211808-1 [Araneus ventricosus]|uniref:Uncharacterized protein n=1 Tax=Araneus ventricosus TaxID=182803 RepID=A0A4Y2FZ91_ARAVE|nr:hypothetical protein AVEN_96618-1 [Araneus ventricosus]GBM45106.1 hypothetical protein AVEN_211808-1 [Araneus ventricosus]